MTEFLHNSAVWGILLTVVGYGLGSFINRKTGKAWCNPLLLGILFVILVLSTTRPARPLCSICCCLPRSVLRSPCTRISHA